MIPTIAIMCESKQATKLKYSFAAVAALRQARFFYFTPDEVDIRQRMITGHAWLDDGWVTRSFPYPDAICDLACRRGKQYDDVYEALKDIPMTTDIEGRRNKLLTNRLVREAGLFADYIIPSRSASEQDRVLDGIDLHRSVILKPTRGSQGKQVYLVRRMQEDYEVVEEQTTTRMTRTVLAEWVNETIIQPPTLFMMQRFIKSVTKDGNPFDIRVHLVKGERGEWQIARSYPRIGAKAGVVSNFSAGGYLGELKKFYETQLKGRNYLSFQRTLQHFSLAFAAHLEQLHGYNLQEMGLDLGIDPKGKLWLFEANTNRLGTYHLEIDVAMHLAGYTIFLARQAIQGHDNMNDIPVGKGELVEAIGS